MQHVISDMIHGFTCINVHTLLMNIGHIEKKSKKKW